MINQFGSIFSLIKLNDFKNSQIWTRQFYWLKTDLFFRSRRKVTLLYDKDFYEFQQIINMISFYLLMLFLYSFIYAFYMRLEAYRRVQQLFKQIRN